MSGIFGRILPRDMGFEVKREKQPDVRELSQYFIDSVACVQAGNSLWIFSSPLPITLVTSLLPQPPVRFTAVSPRKVWGLINIFPSGSL